MPIKFSGSVTNLNNMHGEYFEEIELASSKAMQIVALRSYEFEYLIGAPRACCDVHALISVEGDIDDVLDKEVVWTESDELEGQIGLWFKDAMEPLKLKWLSQKRGKTLVGVRVLKRRRRP